MITNINQLLINLHLILASCSYAPQETKLQNNKPELKRIDIPTKAKVNTIASVVLTPYDSLLFKENKKIKSGNGTKSVSFNSNMTKLYGLNLEGMSIYEYSRESKEILRIFKFKPTPGTGWDYEADKPIPSYEEKPVESCISNNDSILWVSLHNAGGIVPIPIQGDLLKFKKRIQPTDKLIYLTDKNGKATDSIFVPLIKTGKTPKVIVKSANNTNLLVSNWHSNNISVLEINNNIYPYARVIDTIPVSAIPRGMVFDNINKKTYIAIMGGATISVVDNNTWKIVRNINIAANPRHLLQDDSGRIYVSYNKLAQIACIDPVSGKTLFTASTPTQPRTMAFSKNKKFIFVTCYSGNKLAVFKIAGDHFEQINNLDVAGNPVGVDVFEDNESLEAWVCSYEGGELNIFTFKKK